MFTREMRLEKDKAHRTARAQLEHVIANINFLRAVDKDGRHEVAARKFKTMLDNGETLRPNILSYTNDLYELTWKGAGLPACDKKFEKRNSRKLRYG